MDQCIGDGGNRGTKFDKMQRDRQEPRTTASMVAVVLFPIVVFVQQFRRLPARGGVYFTDTGLMRLTVELGGSRESAACRTAPNRRFGAFSQSR
jgi:hypothetical protein